MMVPQCYKIGFLTMSVDNTSSIAHLGKRKQNLVVVDGFGNKIGMGKFGPLCRYQ